MMHSSKTRGLIFGTALLAGLAAFGSPRAAHASSTFPAELQKVLAARYPGTNFCVPLCTACHNTTKGGPGDYNVFGNNLYENGLKLPSVGNVGPVVNKVLDMNLDSDGDGKTDAAELADLESPSLPGASPFCSDLTYGCGARIAAVPPPVDSVALFSAGLVALGLIALRRRAR